MLIAGLAAALSSCGGAASISGAPKGFVLTLSQLPYPGFVAEAGASATGVVSNRRMADGSSAALTRLEREGRETGYTATFDRQVSPQEVVGPVVIQSTVSRFSSGGGARQELSYLGRALDAEGWEQVSTGSLGQAAAAFTQVKALDDTEYQSFVVNWVEDNLLNQVRIAGNAATLDLSYALAVARVQQRHEAAS